jgi:uncharacterized protein involved in exopolysaccharide biosynthesis
MKQVESNTDNRVNLLFLMALFIQKLWLIAIFTTVGIIISLYIGFTATPLYTSQSKWLPSEQGGELTGLAALAGLSSLGNTGSNNEAFYSEIIKSPVVLQDIIKRTWPTIQGDSVSLAQIYELDSNSMVPTLAHQSKTELLYFKLTNLLKDNIIEFIASSKVFSLSVTTPDPLTSQAINKLIVQKLKKYDEGQNQSKATKERLFLEDRLAIFEDKLATSEAQLLQFQLVNRDLSAPRTMLHSKQLLREVTINSNLVIEFRKQLELAKANEARKIQDFRIIQAPDIPMQKSYPRKKIILIAGILAGFFVGFLFIILQRWWQENYSILTQTIHLYSNDTAKEPQSHQDE